MTFTDDTAAGRAEAARKAADRAGTRALAKRRKADPHAEATGPPPEITHNGGPPWASQLLTFREAAAICGVNVCTLYRHIAAGDFPEPVRIGSASRIPGWALWARVKGG